MVMGEVIPGIATLAVVLTHRAPLPLAQIGSPFLPRDSRLARLVQAFLLSHIDNLRFHGLSPLLPCLFKSVLIGIHGIPHFG